VGGVAVLEYFDVEPGAGGAAGRSRLHQSNTPASSTSFQSPNIERARKLYRAISFPSR
jgi:hypothetical protein